MHNYHYIINTLLACMRASEHCCACCLEHKDTFLLRNCIKLNRECAEVCLLTSRLLERDSQFTDDMIELCIKVCRMCAEECEKFTQFDFCKEAGDACRNAEKIFLQHA
ncbi:MAG: four-helix bundle copper-binding protein [Cytophagaceae bacterium]|nr:four-helix bundle copper-binding protein [Cytophagaceae bacterium]